MLQEMDSPSRYRRSGAYRKDRRPVMVATGSAVLVGMAGGLATEIGPWYFALRKPSWQPPNWAFAPAWTLIFTLTAIAGVRTWRATPDPAERRSLAAQFATNGALNIAWSFLFFRMRRPDYALAEVAALWLSILGLIVSCGRRSRLSGWLLAPYLAWVSFASVLNAEIVRLNGPFGR